MKTRFTVFLALALALLLTLSGCKMIEVDQAMDNAEVVATVGGVNITKGEALPTYQSALAYQQQLYYYYYGSASLSASQIAAVKDSTLDGLIKQKLLDQKAEELGLNTFTDEELTELRTSAETTFNEAVDYYIDTVRTDDMTDEAARGATVVYLSDNGYTFEAVLDSVKKTKCDERVRESVVGDVVVSDEELQASYDALVASDTTNYANGGYTFEYAMNNGTTVAWMPEGYRTVKHILFKYTDEQTAKFSDIQTRINSVNALISELQTTPAPDASAEATAEATVEATVEATAAPDVTPDPNATAAPEAVVTLDDLNAQLAALNKENDEAHAEAVASFQAKIDDIKARLEAGETFDALMAEYGEDPGMKAEPAMTQGYYVSATSSLWETAFRDGAMALEKIGDISEPVIGANGVHIIYYNADVTPGEVGLDAIRDALSADALASKQTEVYDAKYAEWLAAANVKKYPDKLVLPEN